MRISPRIFIVNGDDTIERLVLKRFEKLHRYAPDERLPQYAGTQAACGRGERDLPRP